MRRRTTPRPPAPTRPSRQRKALRRLAVAVLAFLVLVPTAAQAVVIEDYGSYQPQTSCSPSPKAGTVKLSKWLMKTYAGTGSLGISRACTTSGVSEHKEGRAFDWKVSVHSARDRRYVAAFLKRAFATDASGNKASLARRMGIMYLIWDDTMYSSYRGFAAKAYQGCAVLKGCSDTARHRNHVHISLTRAGGYGRTSWYTGKLPTQPTTPPPTTPVPPTPTTPTPPTSGTGSTGSTGTTTGVLDLATRPYATVSVAPDGVVRSTSFKVRAGTTYKITAAGLYGYGDPSQVADASCSWDADRQAWVAYPSAADAAEHGSLNLSVGTTKLSESTCRASHVYAISYRPTTTAPLRLKIGNRTSGATGRLTVLVSKPATDVSAGLPTYPGYADAPVVSPTRDGYGLLDETTEVTAAAERTWTDGAVEQGATYRLTVAGTAWLGDGVATDGRCVGTGGGWFGQVSLDRRRPGLAHGRLYVDGTPLGGPDDCSSRTHTLTWTAARSGRVELSLWDPLTRGDDAGTVQVRLQRLAPVPPPAAAETETPGWGWSWQQSRGWLRVSASAPGGTDSSMRVRAGERVQLTVAGTAGSGQTDADAACTRTGAGWVPSGSTTPTGQDPLGLWVDGRHVDWRPLDASAGDCSGSHTYTVTFTAAKDGPLRFAVLDLDHRDNRGGYDVMLRRL